MAKGSKVAIDKMGPTHVGSFISQKNARYNYCQTIFQKPPSVMGIYRPGFGQSNQSETE